MSVKRGARGLLRLEQIAVVLAELELFHWIEVLELKGYLPFHRVTPAELRYDTQPKTVRAMLEHLGGAFLKLGQVLALRPDLVGAEYSREFEKLLEAVPPEPWERIAETIARHVPGGLEAFARISRQPLASGSIAQVHRATLSDGTAVAVKVRRKNIREQFASDITLMRMLAERYAAKQGTAVWDANAVVDAFEAYTARELDLRHELRNMESFAKNFAGQRQVHIPKVYPELSSEAVLVMEYIDGERLLSFRQSTNHKRRQRIVHTIVAMAYQQLFADGFFHADLHAGNIFVEQHDRIALLDYGIVGYVDAELKQRLLALFRALTAGEMERTAQVLLSLHVGDAQPNMAELREGLYFALRAYYNEQLAHIPVGKVLMDCIETARRAGLRLPAQLVLFAKSIVTLEGMCAAIDPSFNIIASAKPFLRALERHAASPRNIARQAKALTAQAVHALAELPLLAGKVDRHLRTIDTRIVAIDETFRLLAHVVLRVSKLITAAVLLAAVLLTSALLVRTEPQWHGISLYSLFGAGMALLLLFLIIALMRRKP